MLPLILQEGVKARHVLPQAPEDEEGSIISPRWTRMNRIPRLLDWLLSTLTLIPEHELTRPQQILAGLTLVLISRVLPGGQDIGSISGDVAADAGLRDSIKKSEMFVPSQRPGQVCTNISDFLIDRKSTRLNSSHGYISYAVFCLKKKKITCNFEFPDTFLSHNAGQHFETCGVRSSATLMRAARPI